MALNGVKQLAARIDKIEAHLAAVAHPPEFECSVVATDEAADPTSNLVGDEHGDLALHHAPAPTGTAEDVPGPAVEPTPAPSEAFPGSTPYDDTPQPRNAPERPRQRPTDRIVGADGELRPLGHWRSEASEYA